MCGIAGIHLRDESLVPQLGSLMHEMVEGIVVRGPDSAGLALYGDHDRLPEDYSSVSMLDAPSDIKQLVAEKLPQSADVSVEEFAETTFVRAKVFSKELSQVVREVAPEAMIIGTGDDSVVYKGVGNPMDLRDTYRLSEATGWQGVIHTRLATESAVDAEGAHPYSVGNGLSMVHNGSFANYATVRRDLEDKGVEFDSNNETEVAARFIAYRMEHEGEDMVAVLKEQTKTHDVFFTMMIPTHVYIAVTIYEFDHHPVC